MWQKDKKSEKKSQHKNKLRGSFIPKRSLEDRRAKRARERVLIDPTYGGERRTHTDRRRAKGPLLPTTYLLLELIMILLVIYTMKEIGIPILYYISIILGAFYFFFSCIPRYRIVLKRQKRWSFKEFFSPDGIFGKWKVRDIIPIFPLFFPSYFSHFSFYKKISISLSIDLSDPAYI